MPFRTTFFYTILSLSSISLFSQNYESAIFEINNVKVVVNSNGLLFGDSANGQFVAPYKEGLPEVSTMRVSGVWFAGFDPAGQLRGTAQLYNENGKTDFQAGTLNGIDGSPTGLLTGIYRVTKEDIEAHLADYNDNAVIDNPNPNVFGWPAVGNPYFSQYNNDEVLPDDSENLAGFYDYNSDGIYDPTDGDFPIVDKKGCDFELPVAEILWFVFNDNLPHTESGMLPVKMEIQCEVFAFDCQEPLIANSIFTRFELINRAEENLDSTSFGLFADFEIGNPEDDFFGSSSEHELFFGYNGDSFDENGYGSNPPVMSIKLIRGPLSEFNEQQPLSYVTPVDEFDTIAPFQYYQLLTGTPLDPQATPSTTFYYDGNPNDATTNSEVSAGNQPGNRRAISSYETFTLKPGAINELIAAYTFYQSSNGQLSQNFEDLFNSVDTLEKVFETCVNPPHNLPCTQDPLATFQKLPVSIKTYPNPASNLLFWESLESLNLEHMFIFDINGTLVMERSLDFNTYSPGVNIQSLPSGIYFIKFQNRKGQDIFKKLIISR